MAKMSLPAILEASSVKSIGEVTCSRKDISEEPTPLDARPLGKRSRLLRPGSLLSSMVCLTKAAIGAGVLPFSEQASVTGLAFHISALVLGGVLTASSINITGEVALATGKRSYEEICAHLFHPVLSIFTGFVNACNCLGSAVAYLIVARAVFQVLTDCGELGCRIFLVSVGAFICLPLAIARHVNSLRHLALASLFLLVFFPLSILLILGTSGVSDSVDGETFLLGPWARKIDPCRYAVSFYAIIFAYNNQFLVPQVVWEMETKSMAAVRLVSTVSTSLVFVLYAAITVLGVLAFGDDEKENLVQMLAQYKSEPLATIALISIGLSALMCFAFHVYPIRQFLAFCFLRFLREEDPVQHELKARRLDIVFGVLSALLAVVVANFITSLHHVLAFVRAFAAAYIAFVVPALLILRMHMKAKTRSSSCICWRTFYYIILFSVGTFFVLFGTYTSVHG